MTEKKNSLILFYPECIEFEIMLATELINKDYPVKISTPDGKDHKGSNGMTFRTDLKFGDVNVSEYSVILIPGGDTYSVFENNEKDRILQEANEKDILIGAICAAPLILAKSGILNGRNFTHGFGDFHKDFLAQYWEGANFQDKVLVSDNNIITAKPEGHIDFGVEIARKLNIIKDENVEKILKYYKGIVN